MRAETQLERIALQGCFRLKITDIYEDRQKDGPSMGKHPEV